MDIHTPLMMKYFFIWSSIWIKYSSVFTPRNCWRKKCPKRETIWTPSTLLAYLSINCKKSLPWLRFRKFGSNTTWLYLGVFKPNSPHPCLFMSKGVFDGNVQTLRVRIFLAEYSKDIWDVRWVYSFYPNLLFISS